MKTITRIVCGVALLIGTAISDAEARGGGHGYSFGSSHSSSGEHYTSGYYRSNGTYVSGYHATNPNSTRNDNFSTRGNINPYTGEWGTKPRDEDLTGH
jgi:hypothetical protein